MPALHMDIMNIFSFFYSYSFLLYSLEIFKLYIYLLANVLIIYYIKCLNHFFKLCNDVWIIRSTFSVTVLSTFSNQIRFFYWHCSRIRCRMALLAPACSVPSTDFCLKLLTGNHVYAAHQVAYRARQCPRGGFHPLPSLCEMRGWWGCVSMPCPQRRRIPLIIRAVSPCFTPPCVARRRERGVGHRFRLHPRATSTLPLTRPPISPHLRANSPFLYDVLSPWRFGGQCRPTITRPYLPYYIYVAACGREGLCGVSTLSRAVLFSSSLSLPFLYTSPSAIILQVASIALHHEFVSLSTIIGRVVAHEIEHQKCRISEYDIKKLRFFIVFNYVRVIRLFCRLLKTVKCSVNDITCWVRPISVRGCWVSANENVKMLDRASNVSVLSETWLYRARTFGWTRFDSAGTWFFPMSHISCLFIKSQI